MKTSIKILIAALITGVLLIGVTILLLFNYYKPENQCKRAMEKGTEYQNEGEYVDAIDCFEDVIIYQEDCTQAYLNLLECYVALGELDILQEKYEEVLEIVRNYDEDVLSRDSNAIASIYCLADDVYPKDYDTIVRILSEGYYKTNANPTIGMLYNSYYVSMEELLELNNKFLDYLSNTTQKMMIEADGFHVGVLSDYCDFSYSLEYLFILNADMIPPEEYQRLIDNGYLDDDIDTIVDDYLYMQYELSACNLFYVIYEGSVGDSLQLNYLINCENGIINYDNVLKCQTYTDGLIEYYINLNNQINNDIEMEYPRVESEEYIDVVIKQSYTFASFISLYQYFYNSDANYEKAVLNYELENTRITDYLEEKYEN